MPTSSPSNPTTPIQPERVPFYLRVCRYMGIDAVIFYVTIQRFWTVASGIGTLFFVTTFLTKHQQGFYYVISNFIGLRALFELGLSTIVLHIASHEYAKLEWQNNILVGDEVAKSRLASLFRKALSFYIPVGVIFGILVSLIGIWVFSKGNEPLDVHGVVIPWILTISASVFSFLTLPFRQIMTGCGKIKVDARIYLIQGIFGMMALWVFMALGFGLYSLAIMYWFGVAIMTVMLTKEYWAPFRDLLKTKITNQVYWFQEVVYLQLQSGFISVSNWLLTQFFAPVLLVFQGEVIAGKMGATQGILSAVSALGFYWMSAKVPQMSKLIGARKPQEADRLFWHTLWRTYAIIGTIFFFICLGRWGVEFFDYELLNSYKDRVLGPSEILILSLAGLINHFWSCTGVYLRGYKKEPYMLPATVMSMLLLISNYYTARDLGAYAMCVGYLLTVLTVGLGWGGYIFFVRRKAWQKNYIDHPEDEEKVPT